MKTTTTDRYLDRLPVEIKSQRVQGVNGLDMHVLCAGPQDPEAPTLLLLHGFPELAFSWRAVMPELAAAGFRVVAPDQRGYGLTQGWDAQYAKSPHSFRMLNLVKDAVALMQAMQITSTAAIVGHDFGSPVAGYAALLRPDLFRRLICMSAPFPGPPPLSEPPLDLHSLVDPLLAELEPPRKHYQLYYSGADANRHMLNAQSGLHDFLRSYYYSKSADYPGTRPSALTELSPQSLAQLPDYYIMPRESTMADVTAGYAPPQEYAKQCSWLSNDDLGVYAACFEATGFQGGLNWYRCITDPAQTADLQVLAGARLRVPSCFIGGSADWGVYQTPGSLQRFEADLCADYRGTHLLPDAGHWVQQEQPAATLRKMLHFLQDDNG